MVRSFFLPFFFASLILPANPATDLNLEHSPVKAAVNENTGLEDYLKSLEGKTFYLRDRINSSPKIYCQTAGANCSFTYGSSRLFTAPRKIEVRVESARESRTEDKVYLNLSHRSLGKGTIVFSWPEGEKVTAGGLQEIIRYALSDSAGEDGFRPLVGNRVSRRLHYIGSNHLPHDSLRVYYSTLAEAVRDGYKECSLCFVKFPQIKDYELEMVLGRRAAAEVLGSYSASTNGTLRRRVREAGQRVLDKWPTPLRGYNYSFDVLGTGTLNALACPGGRIFVSAGMLAAVESEDELEGLLAHEITHVERRHGLREYRKYRKTALWTTLAAAAADAAVLYKTKDRSTEVIAGEIISGIALFTAKLILSGYSREFEQEADITALAYLKKVRNDWESYASVLHKIQYSANLAGQTADRVDEFSTHPDIDFRVDCARNAEFQDFAPELTFTGYDQDGEVVAEVIVESQCVSWGIIRADAPVPGVLSPYAAINAGKTTLDKVVKRLCLYATIRTTGELGQSCAVKEIRLRTESGAVKLDNREDTWVFPFDETGCTFELETGKLISGDIEEIELNLNNVKEWRRN